MTRDDVEEIDMMIRTKAKTVALLVAISAAGGALGFTVGAGGAAAQTQGGINVADTDLDLSPFETHPMSVAVAKDRKTGRQFNVVKLPNGKMMALYSVEKLKAVIPFADDSEMMYGNHRGSLR